MPAVIVDSVGLDGTAVAVLVDVDLGVATVVVNAELDTAGVEEPATPAVVVRVVDAVAVDRVVAFAVVAVDGPASVEVAGEEVAAGAAVVVVLGGAPVVAGAESSGDDVLSVCADAAPLPITSTLSAIERTTKRRNSFWSM